MSGELVRSSATLTRVSATHTKLDGKFPSRRRTGQYLLSSLCRRTP